MAESGQEFSGKSVEEAIAEGLTRLKLTREQAEIEVLSKGSRGIFGLGSEPARVRISRSSTRPSNVSASSRPAQPTLATSSPVTSVETPSTSPTPIASAPAPQPAIVDDDVDDEVATDTNLSSEAGSNTVLSTSGPAPSTEATLPRRSSAGRFHDETEDQPPTLTSDAAPIPVNDDELADMAIGILNELVQRMGFRANVTSSWQSDDSDNRYLLLDIHGSDLSPIIGRRGETLASVQYLVRLMVNQRIKQWKNIVVDVEQYKERRVNQLTQLALRMADQVAQSGRAVSLEPMPANERRIVHIALRDHATVYTQSSGEGDRRKVHIVARS